ncbi:serine hydrolase domain-containing protein [Luethyella okanaganae]|uniref:Serine hydrolase domain-containing protein n=1 Tax=Luethyella okanaganae TaxID=69372 RepID=A0ABW1VH93_9MICO
MRLTRTVAASVVVALTAALAGCGSSELGGAAPSATTALAAELQGIVDDALEANGIPGAAVSVDTGAAAPWLSFTGVADTTTNAPVTPEDRFAYRSITKSFIVSAVLENVAAGRIALDDAISEYVPGVPNGETITIRQLAGMRSGLVNYSAAPAFQAAFGADPTRSLTSAELLAYSFELPPNFAPGERYEYSNTNTILLGEMLRTVSGMDDWAGYVAEHVTKPLGLSTVVYPGAGTMPTPAAAGYLVGDGQIEAAPPGMFEMFGAAGGLTGTLADLAAWGSELGTGTLLTPAVQAERTANPSDPRDDPNSPVYDAYGLGIGEIDGWWGHTGYGLGFSALVMRNPGTGQVIAIMLNASPPDHDVPAAMFRRLSAAVDAAG